jgi:hypothetical protein
LSEQFETVDAGTLLPLVRQATGRSTLELNQWSWQTVLGGIGEGLGIFRCLGQATDQGEPVNWSLILKVFGEPAEATPLTAWNYWRREVDVYQSDFLANLPGGIRAPQCFAVQEQGQGRLGLWLEDIVEAKPDWSISDYARVAYDFGRFNAFYLMEQPMPTYSWLSQQWLRGWAERNAPLIPLLQQSMNHPWIGRAYPPDVAQNLFQLWAEREWYLQVLTRLPQTLCHMDAFRRNLFSCQTSDERRETVAIDWAFVGPGAIGEEVVPLIEATVCFLEVDISDKLELEKQVLEGYLAGLANVGWRGNPRLVQLGYMAAASLRYIIGPIANALPLLLNEQLHPVVEQIFKKPMGEFCDYQAEFLRHSTTRLPVEARKLAQELGLA